jgi:OmpA-OmpF porin, OOP family
MTRFFLSFVFIFLFFQSNAQQALSTSNKKAEKLYLKAEKKIKEREFSDAIKSLNESTKHDPAFFEAYLRLGSIYNLLGELDSVYTNFSKYAALSSSPANSVLNRLAFMAFDRGDYIEAKQYLFDFLESVPEMRANKEVQLLAESLKFSQEQLLNPIEIQIEKLPEQINRFKLQYLPSLTIDNTTMIFTKRDLVSGDEDIVVSYFKNNEWSEAESISPKINTSLNEGACTISADGNMMILTSCDRRDSFGSCDLYFSKRNGTNWSKPKNLGKSVNTHYWESQPSLSADGNTLYFSSNRPGGFGGRDLWVSKYNGNDWDIPVNVGSAVNSNKDETTPFIHANNETLFFSSDGFPGMGGFDLFKSEMADSIWTQPLNLGFPINTFRDEVALMIASDGHTGYFAKENQKNKEIIDSDIVFFQLPAELIANPVTYLIGKVIDAETREPLKATIQVIDTEKNKELYLSNSDSITGEYLMVLPSERKIAAYVKKKGYLFSDFEFNVPSNSILKPDTILIELSKVQLGKGIVLHNIYFQTNSYEIDQRSNSEIESVAELLNDNPTINIEISGHTDDIGGRGYNQILSEKRARTIYQKLVENGIDSSRLEFKGYADSKPLAPNTNDFNRQSNRRIEFRVIRLK